MLVKCTRVGALFKRNNMKLGLTKPNFATANSLKEDFELDVGKSDELDKFAKKVSDKSGTEVVKQGNVVRNLGHLNQSLLLLTNYILVSCQPKLRYFRRSQKYIVHLMHNPLLLSSLN